MKRVEKMTLTIVFRGGNFKSDLFKLGHEGGVPIIESS
jgi:hypothetical protein